MIVIPVNLPVTMYSYFNIIFDDFGVSKRIMVVKLLASMQMLAKYVVCYLIYFCHLFFQPLTREIVLSNFLIKYLVFIS